MSPAESLTKPPVLNRDTLVMVALSGGVDSAVVMNLLSQKYGHVHGVSHKHWPESRCCTSACIDTCRSQSTDLGVPYSTVDTMVSFAEQIVDPFVEAYRQGTTPNPCVFCNQRNRFGWLVERYLSGIDSTAYKDYKLATGHYARIIRREGRYRLARGKDSAKDQSYMLYRLSQKQLAHALFPLGELDKAQVRTMAAEWNLESAKKEDSQDICFVEDDYRNFLKAYTGTGEATGDFVTAGGKVLGRHKGVAYYTRGQRKGLGLSGGPWYVLQTNPDTNQVVLGNREELYTSEFLISDCVWHETLPPESMKCTVQVRYHGEIHEAQVTKENDSVAHANVNSGVALSGAKTCWRIRLTQPSLDVSPGQSAVFYADDVVVGGGVIQKEGLVP